MNMDSGERIQRKLRNHHELRRWFDTDSGKYVIPKVRVPSRKSVRKSLRKRATSRARSRSRSSSVDAYSSSIAEVALGRSDLVYQGRRPSSVNETEVSLTGCITRNGLLHTQKRLGVTKGNLDARVLHDAIVASVSKLRKIRSDMESNGLSVAKIKRDSQREAIEMESKISHELALDTNSWMISNLDATKHEFKARKETFNSLVNKRRRLDTLLKKTERELDVVSCKACIEGSETDAVVKKIDAELKQLRARLTEKKKLADTRQNYGRILKHLMERTRSEVIGAPVRQNFLIASENSINAECHHVKTLLEEILKQKDAEAQELEALLAREHDLKQAQDMKLRQVDLLSTSEQRRMLGLLKSEEAREQLAKKLGGNTKSELDMKMKAMLAKGKAKRDEAMQRLRTLEDENEKLIKAFEFIAKEGNDDNVDSLVNQFISRGAKQNKLKSTLEKSRVKLKKASATQRGLIEDLKNANIAKMTEEKNSMSNANSRREYEQTMRQLKPIKTAEARIRYELLSRINILKCIQDVLRKIANLKLIDKCIANEEQASLKEHQESKFEISNTTSQSQNSSNVSAPKLPFRYKGRVIPIGKVVDIVAAVLEAKVRADRIDDVGGNPRDSLPEFIQDFFSQQYGSIVMKKKYTEFKGSLMTHLRSTRLQPPKPDIPRNIALRLQWFSILTGWSSPHLLGNIHTPYHPQAVDVYLQIVSDLMPQNAIEEKLDDLSNVFIDINSVLRILDDKDDAGIFNVHFKRTSAFQELVKTIRSQGKDMPKSGGKVVDFDFVMDQILRTWYIWQVSQPAPNVEESISDVDSSESPSSDSGDDADKCWLDKHNVNGSQLHQLSIRAVESVRGLVDKLRSFGSLSLSGVGLYQEIEKGPEQLNFDNEEIQILANSNNERKPAPDRNIDSRVSNVSRVSTMTTSTSYTRPSSSASSYLNRPRSDSINQSDTEMSQVESRMAAEGSTNGSDTNSDLEMHSDENEGKMKRDKSPLSREEMKLISVAMQRGHIRHESETQESMRPAYSNLQSRIKAMANEDNDNTDQGNAVFRRGSLVERLSNKRERDKNLKLQAIVLDIDLNDILPTEKERRKSQAMLKNIPAPAATKPSSRQPSRERSNPRHKRMAVKL